MKTNHWFRLFTFGGFLVLIQVLIINNLNLNRFMFPQIYILALLVLPVNIKHWVSYLIAFTLGLIVDSFTNTPGLHSFTAVAIMFLRYVYFNSFVDKEWLSTGISPSFNTTESLWMVSYVAIFSSLYHFVLLLLDNFTFEYFGNTLLKILYSSSLSILLILLFLFAFRNKSSHET